jgi:hypothetical protein
MRRLSPEDIDFSRAKPVISAAQKYVIVVPLLDDADALVYPPASAQAGQPMRDRNGRPIGDKGIIFFNEVDRCYQAAAADGRSVIIVNEVTAQRARAIESFVRNRGEAADGLSRRSIELLLAYVRSELGLVDIYNSTDEFIRSTMKPVDGTVGVQAARPSGWMRRDDRDVCHAVFVRGPAQFEGPAATAQQIPACGAFVLRQGREYRMIDAGVMLRTYMHPDSRPLELLDFLH